jgi:hypothetical protein
MKRAIFLFASFSYADSLTCSTGTLVDAISVSLPKDWSENNIGWSEKAAAILNEFGAVVLTAEGSNGLIEKKICDNANNAAASRVKKMHRRIESRGLDPEGVDEPYRFSEIVCRDDGGKRYDVPIGWLGDRSNNVQSDIESGRIGTPLEKKEVDGIAELHKNIGFIAKPVLESLWSKQSTYVAAAGFLVNQPGSESQNWHRDGPDEGYIDCFVPLIDLNQSVGPTSLQPKTHLCSFEDDHEGEVVVPLLLKGEILLFDYRTVHRGQGNKSKSTTRTLAYAVYRRRQETTEGDIHNFPAALTLEFD